jgi:hypothetical protein
MRTGSAKVTNRSRSSGRSVAFCWLSFNVLYMGDAIHEYCQTAVALARPMFAHAQVINMQDQPSGSAMPLSEFQMAVQRDDF